MLMAGQKTTKNKRSYIKWIRIGREFLGSLLFPPRCIVCDEILSPEEEKSRIHKTCESKLYPIKGTVCMLCGRPVSKNHYAHFKQSAYLEVYNSYEYCDECKSFANSAKTYPPKVSYIRQGKALYLYSGDIKKTMYRFKYSNRREYAAYFAKCTIELYGEWIKEKQIQAIVPVPMYLPKKRKRGYNQAECYAKALSDLTGIPMETNLVYRVKNTRPLKELSAIERKNNLKNAFQIKKSIVQYSHILVVDDIYTTGSTVQAVAERLNEKGISHVYAMSICIGEVI